MLDADTSLFDGRQRVCGPVEGEQRHGRSEPEQLQMVPQKPDSSERWRRERLHVVDGQLIKKASPRLQGVGPWRSAPGATGATSQGNLQSARAQRRHRAALPWARARMKIRRLRSCTLSLTAAEDIPSQLVYLIYMQNVNVNEV